MAVEVLVPEVATWVVLHELVALDREAFLVVVLRYLDHLDQSLVVEGVLILVAKAWVVPQMVEAHEKVADLPFQKVVVEGLVEGHREISPEGEVGHWVVWDL